MTVAIIQARMGSSRLPGKVLRHLGDRPVMDWVVRAARLAAGIDDVIVATSTQPADDAVVEACGRTGTRVVRGPAEDVLARFVAVVKRHPHDIVVRLTADCPLLDPEVIATTVAAFSPAACDYLSTTVIRSLPRGLDVEVLSASALRSADAEAAGVDRAHVTSFIYRDPERFRVSGLVFLPKADDLRVTLDTEDDMTLLTQLVRDLGNEPSSWRRLVAHLRSRPDLVALNANVRQKSLDEG